LKDCENCLWACFETSGDMLSDSEDCDFYHPINDEESLEIEYIENMRIIFSTEWDEYLSGWGQ